MKKVILFIINAMIWTSCVENSAEYKKLKSENEMLKAEKAQSTTELNEMLSTLNDIQTDIQRLSELSGRVLPPEEIGRVDALLIPALAVDRGGRRLGQGGGWYDRLLPLRADGVRIFAMVHDDELVTGPLPTEAHDEPVDAVITPEEWFLLEGSAFASER